MEWPLSKRGEQLPLTHPLRVRYQHLDSMAYDALAQQIERALGRPESEGDPFGFQSDYRLCYSSGYWWVYLGGCWREWTADHLDQYITRQFVGGGAGCSEPDEGDTRVVIGNPTTIFSGNPTDFRGVRESLRSRLAVSNPEPLANSMALVTDTTRGLTLVYQDGVASWQPSRAGLHCSVALRYGYVPGQEPMALLKSLREQIWAHVHTEEEREARIRCLRAAFGAALAGAGRHLTIKRALLIHGDPDSGKSTLLNLLMALVNEDNVAREPPQSLGEPDWSGQASVASLGRKTINVVFDMPKGKIRVDGPVKSAISCEPLPARQVKGVPFKVTPQAVHLWACNEIPEWDDPTGAWMKRVALLPLERTLPAAVQRGSYVADLIRAEGQQIQNWLLDGALELLRTGQGITSSADGVAVLKHHVTSHMLSAERFAIECLVPADSMPVSAAQLMGEYKRYCYANGFEVQSSIALGKAIKRMKFRARLIHKTNYYYCSALKNVIPTAAESELKDMLNKPS
jgi:energy-coupling factor transporter ATP-binding protein EcfA2